MTQLPDKVRSGEFHHSMGMYGSDNAALKTIAERPYLVAFVAVVQVMTMSSFVLYEAFAEVTRVPGVTSEASIGRNHPMTDG